MNNIYFNDPSSIWNADTMGTAPPLDQKKLIDKIEQISVKLCAFQRLGQSLSSQSVSSNIKKLQDLIEKVEQLPNAKFLQSLPPHILAKQIIEEAIDVESWLSFRWANVELASKLERGITDDKMLIHLMGDIFAEGSGLEGHDISRVRVYIAELISSLENGDEYAELSSLLANSIVLKKDITPLGIEKLTNRLHNALIHQGKVLIEGGWQGAGAFGHAMYYEVEQERSGTYTFRVYNRGSGLFQHGGEWVEGYKARYPAFVEIQDVSEDKLFDPLFLRALIEMQAFPTKAIEEAVTLYEGVFALLEGKIGEMNPDLEYVMSAQRSGTCTWKSLSAWLRHQLSYQDYKILKHKIKEQALLNYYETNQDQFARNPAMRALLGKCLHNFAKNLESLNRQNFLPSEEMNRSILEIELMHQKLLISDRGDLAIGERSAKEVTCNPLSIDWSFRCEKREIKLQNTERSEEVEENHDLLVKAEVWSCQSNVLVNDLEGFLEQWTEALDQGSYGSVVLSFCAVMKSIPFVGEEGLFWEEIAALDSEKKKQLMCTLSDLHQCAMHASVHLLKANIPPYQPYAFLAAQFQGLAFQDKLLTLSDLNEMELYGLNAPLDGSILDYLLNTNPDHLSPAGHYYRNLYNSCSDPETVDRLYSLNQYFQKRKEEYESNSSSRLLFSLDEYEIKNEYFHKIRIPYPELAYVQRLIKEPDYQEKLNDSSKKWPVEQLFELYCASEETSCLPLHFLRYRRQAYQLFAWVSNDSLKLEAADRFAYQAWSIDRFSHLRDPDIGFEISTVSKLKRVIFSDHMTKAIKKPSSTSRIDRFEREDFKQNDIVLWNDQLIQTNLSNEHYIKAVTELGGHSQFQPINLLGLLNEAPDIFQDSIEWEIVELVFFQDNNWLEQLSNYPALAEMFVGWTHSTYHLHFDAGNIKACAMILNLSRRLENFWKYLYSDDPLHPSPDFLDIPREFRNLWIQGGSSDEEKSLVAYCLLASYAKTNVVNEEEIAFLLESISQSAFFPLAELSPYLIQERGEALLRLGSQILEVVESDPLRWVAPLIEMRFGKRPEEDLIYHEKGRFSSGEIEIDILSGRCIQTGLGGALPPFDLAQNSNYKKIFGKQYLGKYLDSKHFQFVDEGGGINTVSTKLYFTLRGLRLNAEKRYEYENELCELVLINEPLQFPFQAIQTQYSQWMDKNKNRILFFNQKGDVSGVISMTSTANNSSISSVKKEGHPPLFLVDIYTDPKHYHFLTLFEEAKWVNLWADEAGAPQQIEIPRYQLDFKRVEHQGKPSWECEQMPGWRIAEKQYIAPLYKLGITDFLLLENEQGEQKVLLPSKNKPFKFFSYDFKMTLMRGKPKLSYGPMEGLFLAYRALEIHRPESYELARDALNPKHWSNQAATEEEIQYLKNICVLFGDSDPRAVSIRLQALSLLINKTSQSQKQLLSEDQLQQHVKDLEMYVKGLEQYPHFRLEEKVFSKLCRPLLPLNSNISLYLQQIEDIGQLSKQFTKLPSYQAEREEAAKVLLRSWEEEGLPVEDYRKSSSIKEERKKRLEDMGLFEPFFRIKSSYDLEFISSKSGSPALLFFSEYLPIAQEGINSEKQDLRKRLLLMRGSSSPYLTILEEVLENPGKYPSGNLSAESVFKKIAIPALKSFLKRSREGIPFITILNEGRKPLPALGTAAHVPQIKFGERVALDIESIKIMNLDVQQYLTSPLSEEEDKQKETEEKIKEIIEESVSRLGSDKISQRYSEQLIGGCELYIQKRQEQGALGRFDVTKVEKLKEELEQRINLASHQTQLQEEELQVVVNHILSLESLSSVLPSVQGSREFLSLDDILYLHAKSSWNSLIEEPQRGWVQGWIDKYLDTALNLQHLKRCQNRLEDYSSCRSVSENVRFNLEEALVRELTNKELQLSKKKPAYRVLQFYGDLLIRQDQADKLKLLLETGKVENPVVQMIMGSGKTSVMMKLLGLLRADGQCLSSIVLPQELLASMQAELRQGLVGTFDISLRTFEFTRMTSTSTESLRELKEDLETIRTDQACLMTSSESIQCFMLKYLELLMNADPSSFKRIEQLTLMQEIIQLFKQSGSALIDEIDLVLSVRNETNFPVGASAKLPLEEQEALLFLYDVLLTDPDVCKQLKCPFFSKNAAEKSVLFEKESYEHSIKKTLAKALIARAGEVQDSSVTALPNETHHFFKNLGDEQKQGLLVFFQGINDLPEEFLEWIDELPQQQKNILALLKEEMNALLPGTLERNCDEHYGFSDSPGVLVAIPYDKGTPLDKSHFANPHETANYTIQTVLKNGVRKEVIEEYLEGLKSQAILEMEEGLRLADTSSYQEFIHFIGSEKYHLFRLSEKDLGEILETTNADLNKKWQFLRSSILPQIASERRKLNSNAQWIPFFFNKVQGFSGTLDNADTFADSLTPHLEWDVDARSLFALVGQHWDSTNQQLNRNVFSLSKGDSEEMANHLQQRIQKGKKVLAVIDSGGYLNEEDVSSAINHISQGVLGEEGAIRGIAYHDEKGELWVHEKGAEQKKFGNSSVKKEERLTIYRQPYTTGTDIKQDPEAVALVTIGQLTTLRDLKQSCWRMRELDRGQSIEFIVSKDVKTLIYSTLHLSPDHELDVRDILTFTMLNQISNQTEENLIALDQKMQSILLLNVLDVLFSLNAEEAIRVFQDGLIDLFAPESSFHAYDLYGALKQSKPIDEIVEEIEQRYITQLELIQQSAIAPHLNIGEIKERLGAVARKEILPEMARAPKKLGQRSQVKQKQKQKQKMKQQNRVVTLEENANVDFQYEQASWRAGSDLDIFQPQFYRDKKGFIDKKSREGHGYSSQRILSQFKSQLNRPAFWRRLKEQSTSFFSPFNPFVEPITESEHWITTKKIIKTAFDAARSSVESMGETVTENIPKSLKSEIGNATAFLMKWAVPAEEVVIHPFSSFLRRDSEHASMSRLFSKSLLVTSNWLPPIGPDPRTQPFGRMTKPIHQCLIIHNKKTNQWDMMVIDREEAAYFRRQLIKNSQREGSNDLPLRICLYDVRLGIVQEGREGFDKEELQQVEIADLIIQAKFLHGILNFSDSEMEAVCRWVEKNVRNTFVETKNLFNEFIKTEEEWFERREITEDHFPSFVEKTILQLETLYMDKIVFRTISPSQAKPKAEVFFKKLKESFGIEKN